jgi:glycosyltransferase involved in cell wall biosynthesis
MEKVSVIIPTYNRDRFVKEAVGSVLKQNYAQLAVIVVDDGSTDDTRSVIRQISDSRVSYIYKRNGGCSSARNLGLLKAQGQYVVFLDSDDLWPEGFLSTMLSHLEGQKEYGVAYCPFRYRYANGKEIEITGHGRNTSGWLTRNYFGKTPASIFPSSTLIKKTVLDGFFFDELLKNYEDYDFFLRLSTKTQFLFVPDIYVERREAPYSLVSLENRDISPNGPLILERFYFDLGGDKYVSSLTAKHKISRQYRRLAGEHSRRGHRKAAVSLLKKAIRYYPFDLQYYHEFLKALFLNKKKDKMPDWQMPEPLPDISGLYNVPGGFCELNCRMQ